MNYHHLGQSNGGKRTWISFNITSAGAIDDTHLYDADVVFHITEIRLKSSVEITNADNLEVKILSAISSAFDTEVDQESMAGVDEGYSYKVEGAGLVVGKGDSIKTDFLNTNTNTIGIQIIGYQG